MIAICICRNSSPIGFATSLACDSTASCLTILFQFLKSRSICGRLFIVIFMYEDSEVCDTVVTVVGVSLDTCLYWCLCCFKFRNVIAWLDLKHRFDPHAETSHKKSTNDIPTAARVKMVFVLVPLR